MSQPPDHPAAPPARAGDLTIPAGQEGLVRRMVAPPLPPGWTFVRASIEAADVRARYRWEGPPALLAELRLAHVGADDGGLAVGRFRLRLLAPRAEAALSPLRAALVDAVRAAEADFVWERAVVPVPAVPDTTRWTPAAAAPGPGDPEPVEPAAPAAEPEGLRRARADFARGDFDGALDALAAGPAAPDADALRFRLTWQLGRYREALALLDEAIARAPDDPALHATGAVLRAELHDAGRAAAHARAVAARAQDSPGLLLQAATVLLALGHEGEARRAADRVLAASPDASAALWLDVAGLYRGAGDYAAADALYARALALDPGDAAAHLAAGTLRAWRGDAAGAEEHAAVALAAGGDPAPALCLRGAARMLAGDVPRALDDLDRAAQLAPGDPVAAVWRAEAFLRLGRADEALAEARRGGERADDISGHVAAQVVIALAQLRGGGDFPGLPEYVLRPALAALEAEAAAAPGPPGALPDDDDRGPLEALLEASLGRLRGNRSPVATYVRRDGALARLAVPPSPRVDAKRALWRFVATGSRDEALAELDRVHAAVPRAAEPYNYRGELFLYLGEAGAARREFERAIALYGRSRWAYIGLAGAAVLEGDHAGALAHLAEGIERAGAPGPTTFVYRGEALRCLGRADEARADLATAVRRHPGRIGAWVNLALLDAAAGDAAGARATLAEIRRRAPGFASDAARALGLDPLADPGDPATLAAEMLAMLRGNRASSCVTYFTRDGRLRAVPPSAEP